MKIAIVKDFFSTGRGADRAVAGLANGLAERGHEILIVTVQDAGTPFSVQFDPRLQIVRVSADQVASAADAADAIVSTGTNEILLLNGVSKPVIQQFHTYPGSCFKWRHPLRNRAIRKALLNACAVQVLVPSHMDALPRALRRCAHVIGNWPTVEPERPGAATPPEKLIIYPAAFSNEKNQALLIRAFASVAKDFPEWHLELYGNGNQKQMAKLQRLVKSLDSSIANLQGRVHFMGYQNLAAAYSRCSFLAFPSRSEGFGLAITEAAAFGKPSIGLATAHGVNELINDCETGILTKPTVSAFAEGLRRLMEDPALCGKLGVQSQSINAKRYSRAQILDKWESLLVYCAKNSIMI